MTYRYCYRSPIGNLLIETNDHAIIHLDFINGTSDEHDTTPIISQAINWLDHYFHREILPLPPLEITGTTFQKRVYDIMKDIPYGKTMSYKDLGNAYCQKYDKKAMSSQAIGTAVGHNPIVIMLPCHRVVGSHGIGGFGGGIERKIMLLEHEAILDKVH